MTPSSLWDGVKAVLRGKCTEIAVKLNKQRKEKETKLEKDLIGLGKEHKMTRDKKVLKTAAGLQGCLGRVAKAKDSTRWEIEQADYYPFS